MYIETLQKIAEKSTAASHDVPLYLNAPFPHAGFFAAVAVLGFIVSVIFMLKGEKTEKNKAICQFLLALWVLGPPLWFFYEHFYYFPAYGNMDEAAGFGKLKAAQDVTAKVWAAITVVLGALYNKKFSG